ncbi:hypothetical protein TNCT_632011 [Trichonephila clavata]|uniref:Uncharacterized protein n=1 Tax=Trichonephila clavata TaxID=2740835 RepID=A0A8X6LGG9_TRICU|nr:hypothetical protein TNCT_632011 [Trichonephila clavata]
MENLHADIKSIDEKIQFLEGNLNDILPCPVALYKHNFKFKSAKRHAEPILRPAKLTISTKNTKKCDSSFTELVSREVTLQGSELEKMRDDFQETQVLMAKVTSLMESMKKDQGQAKDKLEFIASYLSEHDCQSEVRETQDLIAFFEIMFSSTYETVNPFENAVTGIKERFNL